MGLEDSLCHGRIVFRDVSAICTSYQPATINATYMHSYNKIKDRQHVLLLDRERMCVYGMDGSFFLLSQHLEYQLRKIDPKYSARIMFSNLMLFFMQTNEERNPRVCRQVTCRRQETIVFGLWLVILRL